MNQSDTESIIKEVKSRISREESKIKRSHYFKNALKYAAIFCLIFGLGYYSNNNFVPNNEIQKIIPKADDVLLYSDTDEIILKKEGNKSFVRLPRWFSFRSIFKNWPIFLKAGLSNAN